MDKSEDGVNPHFSKKPRTHAADAAIDCSGASTEVFHIASDDEHCDFSSAWGSSISDDDDEHLGSSHCVVEKFIQTDHSMPPQVDMRLLCEPADLFDAAFSNCLYAVTNRFVNLHHALKECGESQFTLTELSSDPLIAEDVASDLESLTMAVMIDIQSCVQSLCNFQYAFNESRELSYDGIDTEFAVSVDLHTLPTSEVDNHSLHFKNALVYLEQQEILKQVVPFCASLASISFNETLDALSDMYLAQRLPKNIARAMMTDMDFDASMHVSLIELITRYSATVV